MVTAYDRGRTGPLYASNSPSGSVASSQGGAATASVVPGSPKSASKWRAPVQVEVSPADSEDDESYEDDDERESRALMKASGMTKELIKTQLNRLSQGSLRPKVPQEPAPASEWHRANQRVPAALLLPPAPTVIDRFLGSSIGRGFTFLFTLFCFLTAIICLLIWEEPERQADGDMFPAATGLAAVLAMYILVPNIARRADMAPSPQGADWKPYLALYRCSFILAIPALLCLGFGYGAQAGFGLASPGLSMAELTPDSLRYFQVGDGYVALNLTKGISETRTYLVHGAEGAMRRSRFRDAELRINREPFADIPEPTIPPGFLRLVRVAPIFAEWTECVTKYQISITCLNDNPVVGWAVTETKSLCTTMGMVSCRPPETRLEPVYLCGSTPVYGIVEKGPVKALCGRVRRPPCPEVLDELKAVLMLDGWKDEHLPNASTVWVNVDHDPCIDRPQDCLLAWSAIGAVGAVFSVLTLASILIPCFLDCRVDDQIRRARAVEKRRAARPKKTLV